MTTSADPTPTEAIDPAPTAPAAFRAALESLALVATRPEIEIGELPAPTRLAPWSHALSAEVVWGGDRPESASGRLVLLHNPDGVAAWDGTLRIVIFLTAEVDDEIARDPLLPDVAWSWLTDCLELSGAGYTALGGTVTSTSSTRFGDIAGPGRTDDLEIRASWTATDTQTGLHLVAFTELLAIAAGLPPEGVASIGRPGSTNVR
ncbi:Protein of unknown function [Nakamurella panacisegetis]|uniref:DUF3000 domain-containing protein n=1 Tax=Nakamurella panacisegetis TaxID=1090615 RepID=A0A1H0QKT0_9ACTN|nr:DUF3000 domain-containing protein [Nakamurella panacisegetis]SDP17288.1 Protein of unknown function [Nakamurella panacisegetis]